MFATLVPRKHLLGTLRKLALTSWNHQWKDLTDSQMSSHVMKNEEPSVNHCAGRPSQLQERQNRERQI